MGKKIKTIDEMISNLETIQRITDIESLKDDALELKSSLVNGDYKEAKKEKKFRKRYEKIEYIYLKEQQAWMKNNGLKIRYSGYTE